MFFPSRLEWNPCDVGTLMGSKKKQLKNLLIDKKKKKEKKKQERKENTRCDTLPCVSSCSLSLGIALL